jgi:hypothetical protein
MQEMLYLSMTMQSLSLLRADDFTLLMVSIVFDHKTQKNQPIGGIGLVTDPKPIINEKLFFFRTKMFHDSAERHDTIISPAHLPPYIGPTWSFISDKQMMMLSSNNKQAEVHKIKIRR